MSGGRIRSLKPEILADSKAARLSHSAWRLFVSCILLSDDYGNFHATLKHLDASVFWGRDAEGGVLSAVQELIEASLVVWYSVRGQSYIHLTGWSKHQKIDRRSRPHCPDKSQNDDSVSLFGDSPLFSRDTRETLASASQTSAGPTSYPRSLPGSISYPEGETNAVFDRGKLNHSGSVHLDDLKKAINETLRAKGLPAMLGDGGSPTTPDNAEVIRATRANGNPQETFAGLRQWLVDALLTYLTTHGSTERFTWRLRGFVDWLAANQPAPQQAAGSRPVQTRAPGEPKLWSIPKEEP